MTNHLISIIIPIYNTERYISDIINDVLSQTHKNFELILINDGSIDRSGQICDIYANSDNRIKVIHKNNMGVSAARNDGIQLSKGEFICFIDADDRIDRNYIEALYYSCVKNEALMSACPICVTSDRNEILSIQQIPDGCYTSIEALKHLFEFKNLNTGPCAKLYHKSLFDHSLKFPNIKTYEDLIVSYKTLYKAKTLSFTKETKYIYIRRKGSGAMENYNIAPTNDVIIAINQIISFIKDNVDEILESSFYSLISQILMYLPILFENDPKIKKTSTKLYISETKKVLMKFRKELYKNKTIPLKEKVLFLFFSYSFSSYYNLYKISKWRRSH